MEYTNIIHDSYNLLKVQTETLDEVETQRLGKAIEDQYMSDTHSIIVCLKEVENITTEACHLFEVFHNKAYEAGNSLVFSEPTENVYKKLKQEQLHLVINICPTHEEAVDIISMEIMERDLLNED